MSQPKITKSDVALRRKAEAVLEARKLAGNLYAFFVEAWKVLYPDVPLTDSWHYEYLCECLQYASSGQMKKDHPECRGAIINVPPRTLKSTLVNIVFPDWVWASRPEKKFMCISYGQELAVNEIATKSRKLLFDPWFAERWSKVEIQEDVNLKHRFDTTAGGYRIATTPGGFASGSGANFIIIDDIIKLDDAYSVQRETANSYYENELYSRLNNQAEDFFIVISQRLHENDLPGYLNSNEPGLWWNVIIPLVCEEDTEYVFPISGKKFIRLKGDVLLPDRFPPHVIAALKKSSVRWQGQYQQNPIPATGNLINPNWWREFESDAEGRPTAPLPLFDMVTLSVDSSYKGTQESDYNALLKTGHVKNDHYHLECRNEKMDVTRLESQILDMVINNHGVPIDVLLVEETANGAAVITRLKTQSLPVTIVAVKPEGGKLSRAMAAQPEAEVGNCVLPKTAPWRQNFTKQLADGPLVAKNDDMIDAWSQDITYRRTHRYGFFEAMSEQAAKSKEPKEEKSKPTVDEITTREKKVNQVQLLNEFKKRLRRGVMF